MKWISEANFTKESIESIDDTEALDVFKKFYGSVVSNDGQL